MADFLNPSTDVTLAPTAQTTETVLPDWYTNYAQQILSNQQAVAENPYATYQGPRVAGFNPTQQAAFDQVGATVNSYQPGMAAAGAATQGALSTSAAGAAQPYFDAATSGPTGAQAAQPFLGQAAGMSSIGAAQPFLGQAAGMSGVTAATPGLQAAGGLYTASTNPYGMQAAQPYLDAAGQTSVANIGAYMNPYTQQVVDRIGDVGARTLREKLLPEISDQFVSAGGYGGSRQAEAIGKAVREASEGITAEQARALEAGYGTALTASSSDLARQGQLASTAGSLGAQQQGALSAAASGMAGIGSTLGSLTAGQQSALANIGQTAGSLTNAQQGVLSGIGSTMGGLTADQQKLLAAIGSSAGGLAGADAGTQLQAGAQLAAQAGQTQQLGLTGAGALQSVGNQQQALSQQNLDVAYSDFLKQQGYDQTQIDAMLKTLQGVAPAVPKATLQTGYGPASAGSTTTTPSGSQTLANILGMLQNTLGS